MAAVAAGAVAVAGQHLKTVDEPAERNDETTPLAFAAGGGHAVTFTGVGGSAPAPGVLPLPEVMTVQQDTREADVSSLANGERIAQDRLDAERRAAEEAARQAADRQQQEREATEGRSQLPVVEGDWVLPAKGRFTSGFGARWGTTHLGIDIANAIGTPIYSVADGVVVESGPASGFGMWVRVQHEDGTVTIYGHINESLVSTGQEVAAGEQIATMGNRGQSTGPHLHFEVWLPGGEKTNPADWLREQGVDL